MTGGHGGGDGGGGAAPITRTRLVMAAGAMAGIQVCYSAQINHGSSALLALGLDESKLSLAWLAGPLSGMIVQPIVGIASDGCRSPLGKRRPFLIAGAALTVSALLLFSNAQPVAEALLGAGAPAAHRFALAIAVFSFFLLDFAIQAIQAPLRALITDVAQGDLLPVGNVYIALFTGMGNLVGSLLASRKLSVIMPVFRNDTQALFFLAAAFLSITVATCVFSVTEVPLPPEDDHATSALDSYSRELQYSRASGYPSAPAPPERAATATSAAVAADADAVDAALSHDVLLDSPMRPLAHARSNSSVAVGAALPRTPPMQPATQAFFRVSSSPSMWSLGIGDWSPSVGAARGSTRAALLSASARRRLRRSSAALAGATGENGVYAMLYNAPRPFWRVFIVQLFTWFGFFSLFVFVNAWVGTNVYLGRGSAPESSKLREMFEDGVRLGGVGNALTALVTVAYSPLITVLLERFGVLRTYAFSQLVEAACLLSAHAIRGTVGQTEPSTLLKLATVLDIGAFGIVWATTMGVPWAIIGKALNDDPLYQPRIGLFTTVFNVSQSFPQLFVSFGSPYILARFDNDVSAVMFIGGLLALVGAVLVYALRVDIFADGDDEDEEEGTVVNSSYSGGESVPSAKHMQLPPSAGGRESHAEWRDTSEVREPFLSRS